MESKERAVNNLLERLENGKGKPKFKPWILFQAYCLMKKPALELNHVKANMQNLLLYWFKKVY